MSAPSTALLARETIERNIDEASEFLKLTPSECRDLREPEEVFELTLNIGRTAASKIADTDELKAWIVVHDTRLGRPRGGMSATPGVSQESVSAKGASMTPKNALDPDPEYQYGSGKTGIRTNERIFGFLRDRNVSVEDKKAVIGPIMYAFVGEGLYTGALSPNIGPRSYTFAPDEGTSPLWMSAGVKAMETHTGLWVPALATAKPVDEAGVEGRGEATGRGEIVTLREVIKSNPRLREKLYMGEEITMVLHGFGNVNSYAWETLLAERENDEILSGVRVVGAADHTGAYFNQDGIELADMAYLRGLEKAEGTIMALDYAIRGKHQYSKDPRTLLSRECDVIMTAARPNTIATRSDRSRFPLLYRESILAENIRASVVIEGGNGSITFDAQKELASANVEIATGAQANSAGSMISWDESRYGLRLMEDPEAEAPTLEETRETIRKGMARRYDAVRECATAENIPMPQAAFVVALTHLQAA